MPTLAGLGDEVPLFVATQTVVEATVGFRLHRGVVACASRITPVDAAGLLGSAQRLLVIEGVNDHENLGGLFRNAAAFGVDAVLLDPSTADPLYRRSVRVSLGHVLRVPFARLEPWPAALDLLHTAGVETVALTPDPAATPIAEVAAELAARDRRTPLALLVGAEGPGLTAATRQASARRVRIPMAAGVDSLNVATAAAVALHALPTPDRLTPTPSPRLPVRSSTWISGSKESVPPSPPDRRGWASASPTRWPPRACTWPSAGATPTGSSAPSSPSVSTPRSCRSSPT